MIMEFVNTFSKLLFTKDFFPAGLSVEIMERALTENEVFFKYLKIFIISLFSGGWSSH